MKLNQKTMNLATLNRVGSLGYHYPTKLGSVWISHHQLMNSLNMSNNCVLIHEDLRDDIFYGEFFCSVSDKIKNRKFRPVNLNIKHLKIHIRFV